MLMTNSERLQKAWHHFDDRQGHLPNSARQAAQWAVAAGFLELPEVDHYEVLAEQIAQALRAETKTDAAGRRYRVNHAVRVTKGGVQYTLWGAMPHVDSNHMERSLAQRREQIIGDCCRLKTDVDVHNDFNKDKPGIQLVLDFSEDVAEREQSARMKRKAA